MKQKIRKLVEQELGLLGFKNQVAKEEVEELASAAFQEVKDRENFYFSIDSKKKEKNIRVYNVKAPGNTHRHPSVALPHEHIHV